MNDLHEFLNSIPEVSGKEITSSKSLRSDLGIDSVGIIELMMWLERVKGILPSQYKMTEAETVGDIEEVIRVNT